MAIQQALIKALSAGKNEAEVFGQRVDSATVLKPSLRPVVVHGNGGVIDKDRQAGYL